MRLVESDEKIRTLALDLCGHRIAVGAYLHEHRAPVLGQHILREPHHVDPHDVAHREQLLRANNDPVRCGVDLEHIARLAVCCRTSETKPLALADRVGVGAVVIAENGAINVHHLARL